jgi:hypothetical protein
MKNVFALICAILMAGTMVAAPKAKAAATAKAKVNIVKCDPKAATSFAIFVDNKTYNACKAEIDSYRKVLQNEGLGTYILSSDWARPEDVKAQIIALSKKKPLLEGMVFIGDIPIARVRQAQFMTTAFKMNENTFPREESSVTSDRYYDDLHLDFEFIGQDENNPRWFYYNLTENGAQKLSPNFYSARMRVPEDFPGDKMEVMKKYLQKVVAAHKEVNPLDHFIFFAGHGYNSDCLNVWRQQPMLFREYFPQAFKKASGNKFYNFRQDNYMKFRLYNEIQRPETDVLMFSEHGSPDTQYINGIAPAYTIGENIESLKRTLRNDLRRAVKRNPDKKAEYIKEMTEHYHLNPALFSDEAMEAERINDSLASANINIVLEDILKLKTGARLTIFNACYNGSFHEKGYVAGYHIFNDGRNVVAQGNTVNVLQDKWADQLIGYLALGIRAGFWQKEVCYLESHMIGDPTFKFTAPEGVDAAEISRSLAFHSHILDGKMKNDGIGSSEYWMDFLNAREPIFRAMAVKQLSELGDLNSADLAEIFEKDKSRIVRLQALTAIAPFVDENTFKVVEKGIFDPFEMIRRQSCHYAGKMGAENCKDELIDVVRHSHEVVRTQYAAQGALNLFKHDELPEDIAKDMGYFYNNIPKMMETIKDLNADDLKRESEMRTLRNNPLHWKVDELLEVAGNASQSEYTRLVMIEALGWFNYSVEREKIANVINGWLATQELSPRMKREMIKTVKRLRWE